MSDKNGMVYILQEARRLVECGLSVVPVKADGSKAVALTAWTPFQRARPTDAQIGGWFSGVPLGIAVVNGAVSGNLETLDFDEPGLYEEWHALASGEGAGALLDALPVVATPSGGRKAFWRSPVAAPRTQYLAYRPVPGDPKRREIRIETQGEGKSSLVPPSPAACHPLGIPYAYLQGHLAAVPTITAEEREWLLSLARTFNLWTPPPAAPPPAPRRSASPISEGDLRPGDDFNQRGEWGPLLQSLGMACKRTSGGVSYWGWADTDGKDTCVSIGVGGGNQLYNFSSNAYPLEPETSYSLFGAYATLRHGGDFAAATRALAAEGYGTPQVPPARPRSARSRAAPAESSGDGEASDDEASAGESSGNSPPANGGRPPGGAKRKKATGGEWLFNLTDLGNAKRLIARHGHNLRYCHAWGRWLVWNGRYWKQDANGEIYRLVHEMIAAMREEAARAISPEQRGMLRDWCLKCESLGRMEAMIKIAQSLPGVPVETSDLDQKPMKLTVRNGTLDLATGELLEADRGDLITKTCAAPYLADAPCALWTKFLTRILDGDSERMGFIQRAVGFALTGDTRRRSLVILHGKKGNNGKSTFVETIQALLGDYSMATSADLLMVRRKDNAPSNDIARLRGARFVSASESEENQRLSEALLKQMTGGDMMTARFLNQEFFDFKPEFKLFLSTNHRPEVRGTDGGLWDRLHMVPFDVRIPDAEIDKSLPQKLLRELPGILAWAVAGCLAWQRDGLGCPESVASATAEYRKDMDIIGKFLEDRCVLGDGLRVPATALYKTYESWCIEGGEYVQKQTAFGRSLTERGITAEKSGGVGYRLGIGLMTLTIHPGQ